MKRIYAFTLDGEESVSRKFRSDLRLIAYLMYDTIYNYDGENSTALIINKNIVYNNIRERTKIDIGGIEYYYNEYYFDSDVYDDGCKYYEPFIIGERTFAFTIDDQIMGEEVIKELLYYTLRIANLNYNFNISSVTYPSCDKEDEKHRKKTIDLLFMSLGYEPIKRNIFTRKKKINSSLGLRKKIGIL